MHQPLVGRGSGAQYQEPQVAFSGEVAQRFVRNPALTKVVANTRLVLSELGDAVVGDLCASEADKIDLLQLH
jgi:hypothetical protein